MYVETDRYGTFSTCMQGGLGISSGTNNVADGNKLYMRGTLPSPAGNAALYVWKQHQDPCGPTVVKNNIASHMRDDGYNSGYWDGGGCAPVTLSGNMFGEAARIALEPTATKLLPPPSIPPQPYANKVDSPWTR